MSSDHSWDNREHRIRPVLSFYYPILLRCSDIRHLVRDATTIKVFFKHLILEFCAVICSYYDDRRLKKNSDPFQKRYNHFCKFLWCSSTSASLFLLRLLLDTEGTLSLFVLLLGYGLLVLVLSTPVDYKPFTSEFTSFLVMTEGCKTEIGFVLSLALTMLGTCSSSLEVLEGLILNIPEAITLSLFTPLDSCGVETEFEVTGFDKA
nr:hypothetical protein [Tanacetum cinerariifolium]